MTQWLDDVKKEKDNTRRDRETKLEDVKARVKSHYSDAVDFIDNYGLFIRKRLEELGKYKYGSGIFGKRYEVTLENHVDSVELGFGKIRSEDFYSRVSKRLHSIESGNEAFYSWVLANTGSSGDGYRINLYSKELVFDNTGGCVNVRGCVNVNRVALRITSEIEEQDLYNFFKKVAVRGPNFYFESFSSSDD